MKYLSFLQPPKGWGDDEERKKNKRWTEQDMIDRVSTQKGTRSQGKSCVLNIILLASASGEKQDRCIGVVSYNINLTNDNLFLRVYFWLMSNLIDAYIENQSNINYEISRSVQLWLYLISNILSILCCCFVLFYLLIDRTLRTELHNHVIIVLLFICLFYESICIPFIVYNYYFDTSWETRSISYRFWSSIDIVLNRSQLIILAWATIERHILIFHGHWLLTKEKRFYIHYLPIIILIVYCLVWYCLFILFSSCFNINNQSNSNVISYLCMLNHRNIKHFDLICHQIIPSFIIIILSIVLLLRVRWQKTSFYQSADWTKQRRMIVQILSISMLYFLFYGPWILVMICVQFSSLKKIALNIMTYAFFFSDYFIFLLPFVCYASLPEVQLKLKKLFCYLLQKLQSRYNRK
ncbi:unnamed protein product [Rotaria sp. Silwood2]|nr:unnamed protein product [Rotaria sp. Silwood2]CAF4155869.1 unnamed protein product [Rotaria sp. Silwood2]